jgi:hypothetical protein
MLPKARLPSWRELRLVLQLHHFQLAQELVDSRRPAAGKGYDLAGGILEMRHRK